MTVSIQKRVAKYPDDNHLIIYVVAGHGMMQNGRQAILINELDPRGKFYKKWSLELNIRDLAKNHPDNTYQIVFFGCCREPQSAKHTAGFSMEEAHMMM